MPCGAGCSLKLQFHRSLTFERTAMTDSRQRRYGIEEPADARCTWTTNLFLQHPAKDRRFVSGERAGPVDFVKQAGRRLLRVLHREVSTRQGERSKRCYTP